MTDAIISVVLIAAAILFWWLKGSASAPTEEPKDCDSPIEEPARREKWIELLTLEYERAADRYDNIYKAIWQNFSYMAALAAGILTFGKKALDGPALYALALTPLSFWFIATFLPMDHYGDETRKRLSEIEGEINKLYFPKATDPKIRHFSAFKHSKYKWRVRGAVKFFVVPVVIAWLVFGVLGLHRAFFAHSYSVMPAAQTIQLEAEPLRIEVRDPGLPLLRDSLASLSRRAGVLDSLVRRVMQTRESVTSADRKGR